MAKKNDSTQEKINSKIDAHDKQHTRNAVKRQKKVEKMFDEATKKASIIASATSGKKDSFELSKEPAAKKRIDEVILQLNEDLSATIINGDKEEWLLSANKNDAMVDYLAQQTNLPSETISQWKSRNLDALEAFQQRKIEGMNLSTKVWNITDQFKGELEMAIDVALGDGVSAAAMSRTVRKLLNNPTALFRRVRDKNGQLRLSQNAKNYHPGRGVYRSAYRNALRLTATETNMAYRTADHTRWQQLNFVTGIEIKLSNNHNCRGIAKGQFYDICDELAGVYPKDFKFVGWHPFCRCFAIPKLADMDEFLKYQDKFVAGEDVSGYKFSGEVTQMPKQFNEWVKANEKRIKSAKSLPYFIRDNYVGGDISKGLKFEKKLQQARKEQEDALAPYRTDIAKARQLATKWGLSIQLSMLDKYVAEKNIAGIQSRIATIQQKANEMIARDKSVRSLCKAWGLSTYILDEAMKNPNSQNILSAMSELENRCITAENDYKQYITDANSAISEAKANNIDATDVQNDVNVVSNDKREWNIGKTLIRERLRKLWDLISNKKGVKTSKMMPKELKSKSDYLNGEDYTFEKDFFDLLDPNKPIKLEIVKGDKGSYSTGLGDKVHLEGEKRKAASRWECKAVVYHEYGHCIDAQRALWTDTKLIDLRNSQIKRLMVESEYTIWERKWNHKSGGWYFEKVSRIMPRVEYIDTKLIQLEEKIITINEEVFVKRGISKYDVLEQICSTRDTIKSLIIKYGAGHPTAYFKKLRMSETEYLAHAFENAFLGNRIFEKYLPDIYEEMIGYIKSLKKLF